MGRPSMDVQTRIPDFGIRPAVAEDVPLILAFIRELAEYEKLSHEVVATEDLLRKTLFGDRNAAEVILGYLGDKPVGFAHAEEGHVFIQRVSQAYTEQTACVVRGQLEFGPYFF